MQYGFSLDPREILGLGPEASLQELRDAYREKAKRYHPDHGGDEWVFRIVKQAYEILGTARVAGHAATDTPRQPEAPRASPVHPPTAGQAASRPEKTRPGIRDTVDQPAKLVEVEVFLLRYAITDPMQVLLGSADDRTLSCNLNVAWPSKGHMANWDAEADAPNLDLVSKAFDPIARKTRAIGSHAQVENGRFTGWLSYASEIKVKDALQVLHKALRAQGLGMDQWTREMLLPREG